MTKILQGDSLEVLKKMESGSVDMCMTSPPYWGLRDYGDPGQLGLEPTFQEYIDKLVGIFDEVKRVLKDTGTCWVNLGDTYASGGGKAVEQSSKRQSAIDTGAYPDNCPGAKLRSTMGKSLIGIPERFVIAMTDAGWIRRNTIIWHKPNCMPSSASDRFTVDFEYLYFFSKSKKYWFDQQFDEANTSENVYRNKLRQHKKYNIAYDGYKNNFPIPRADGKRNKRCVWKINTKPYKGAHFAVYPEELIRTPILAGCPKGGIILDPFMGSGTTLKVARDLDRKGIGIEINQEYIELAKKRIDIKQEMLKL